MQRENRRLAAIVAADIAGYSRLIGQDEEGTLRALRAHRRELIDQLIERHGGRIANTAGDSLLLEFPSAVDAVRCAVAIQQEMATRNRDVDADKQVRFRLGIHVGDVVAEGDDLLGDGVNVAARLESLSDPGGAILSDDAYRQVRDRLDLEWRDDGEHEVKNIARPLRVWRWSPDQPGAGRSEYRRFGRLRPTIAVLPFDNISGDREQEYFADGLTEDLITALTHWRSFPVIARNSTFTYKGKSISIPQAARELGANYIVEGSVRKAGSRVRVTAQLIEGPTGHHVWAERYDRDLNDIFEVQDDLVHRIAAVLAPEVSRAELSRSASKRPNDLNAWDHWLRGTAALERQTTDATHEALGHFERAIMLDPDYSDAHASLAHSLNRLVRLRAADDHEHTLRRALQAVKRAIELDPRSSRAHSVLSTTYILRNEHDLALAEAHYAVDLNPNDPDLLHGLGNKSDLAGDPDGIARMEFAQQLNPRDPLAPSHLTFLARAYVNARDHQSAVARAQAAIGRDPGYAPAHFILAIALAHEDRLDEAAAALEQSEILSPGIIESREDWRPYTDEASNKHLRDGLAKAKSGMKNG